jgi:hypothetical protein
LLEAPAVEGETDVQLILWSAPAHPTLDTSIHTPSWFGIVGSIIERRVYSGGGIPGPMEICIHYSIKDKNELFDDKDRAALAIDSSQRRTYHTSSS